MNIKFLRQLCDSLLALNCCQSNFRFKCRWMIPPGTSTQDKLLFYEASVCLIYEDLSIYSSVQIIGTGSASKYIMLKNVSSWRRPLALALAAWKNLLNASIHALLWPDDHRDSITCLCFSMALKARQIGTSHSTSLIISHEYFKNQVIHYLATQPLFTLRPQRKTRQLTQAVN